MYTPVYSRPWMSEDRSGLGRRIRAARERRGRNRNQMARDLGTSWQHVDRWERGTTAPSPESLRKLAAYLDVSVDHLLGNDVEPAPAPLGESTALEEFFATWAPSDITDREIAWLRAAPVDPEGATPGDYVNMLHGLRSTSRPASTPPPPRITTKTKPRSGRQRKVDVSAILSSEDVGGVGDVGEGSA